MDEAVVTNGLQREFAGGIQAVAGVDLAVPAGEVFGFLGPNGAGKSTTVRMLVTLLRPTGGHARVAGHDVVRDADAVRRCIGVALQDAAIDPFMTGRELLRLQAVLHGIPRRDEKAKAIDLLERVGLTDAGDRQVRTYSGGMRRRLDLALALVHEPEVLFLDEPTTGLDPRARNELWDVLDTLVAAGTTILLTTQYLDEADRLADDIVVIDHGRVIARGDAASLKRQVGGAQLTLGVADPADRDRAAALIAEVTGADVHRSDEGRTLSSPTEAGADAVARLSEAVRAAGIAVDEIALAQPTLDDVFLTLTGSRIADEETA